MEADRAWHLDKKVPIALIAAIAMQTVGLVWWAASLSERVNQLERQQTVQAPQGDRLTRVEVTVENIKQGVDRIERRLFGSN